MPSRHLDVVQGCSLRGLTEKGQIITFLLSKYSTQFETGQSICLVNLGKQIVPQIQESTAQQLLFNGVKLGLVSDSVHLVLNLA